MILKIKIKIKYNDSNNFSKYSSKYSSKYISEYVSIYDRIVTGILVCYRFPRSYRMGVSMVGSILAAWWLCCGSVRDRLHSSIFIQ
jgi:hypothetical protein